MPGRLWRSWKDWMAGCRCGTKGASLLPRGRHPVIETASAQGAPPSPVFLRNGLRSSASAPVPPSSAHSLGERWIEALDPLDSGAEDENGRGMITDDVATASRPAATPARNPTFPQKERWKAIQKARRKGMSLRAIERELGIHRATIKKYMDAAGSPTRRPWAGLATPSSDTMAP